MKRQTSSPSFLDACVSPAAAVAAAIAAAAAVAAAVAVAAAAAADLPPLMDVCQDLILTYKVSHEDQREYKISGSDLQREAEFIADSIAPEAVKGNWLKEILQAKLDALVLQDEHYKAPYSELHSADETRVPKWLAPAKVFLKSLLAILQREGVLADDGVDPSVDGRQIAEAVKLAESEERMAEVTKAMHAAATSYHRWAMRVAAYLAYCVQEGILGPRFSLADLSEAPIRYAHLAAAAAPAVALAAVAATAAAAVAAVAPAAAAAALSLQQQQQQQPEDRWQLLHARNCLSPGSSVYIVRSCCILLECGYIAKLYPRHEEAAYIEMLRALLTGANTVDFKVTLCKQILKATGSQTKTAYDVLYTIIPALVQTMRSKEATSSGSTMPLLHLCAASLVNMSAGDLRTKEILLEGGWSSPFPAAAAAAEIAATAAAPAPEETAAAAEASAAVETAAAAACAHACVQEASVVQAAVMLLLNLTKLAAHRQKFLAVGGLYPIVDLLMHNYASDFQSKQRLLSTLMGVVGQLANDEDARTDMTERFPVVDFVLFGFHNAGDNVEYKTKVLFALKQLSVGRWQVQQRVGKHVICSLVSDLRATAAADFVMAALSLLQVKSALTALTATELKYVVRFVSAVVCLVASLPLSPTLLCFIC
ncbi:hypothetical protein Emed_006621 [Eimeria media]